MSVEEKILAGSALEIVRRSFSAVGPDELKTFRIKNLSARESLELLDVWQTEAAAAGLADVRIVVASDTEGDFPVQYRADPSRSITWYRNNIRGGLVYVETKVESDEQGLKNLFTLQDQDYLSGTFDTDDFRVAEYMIRKTVPGSPLEAAPGQLLVARLFEVLRHFRSFGTPIPVRRFLRFVCSVRQTVAAREGSLEQSEVDALVGEGLVHLGLFPDTSWRSAENKTGRRLQLNMLRADLASSFAADHDADKLAQEALAKAFRATDGTELPEDQQRDWRLKCSQYCLAPSETQRLHIPYGIFEQIFEKDVKGLRLGDRVSEEISDRDRTRHPELLSIDVVEGLNRRRREDAQKLLDAQPLSPGDDPLRDLLSKATRRLVERLAKPVARPIRDPVLQLAKSVLAFRDRQTDSSEEHRIEVRLLASSDLPNETAGLLAFIYGGALRQLVEESAASEAAWGLSVDERLLTTVVAPSVQQLPDSVPDADEDVVETLQWSPLEIEYRLVNVRSGRIVDSEPVVKWQPEDIKYLALFWLSVSAADRAAPDEILNVPPDSTAQAWVSAVTDRKLHLSTSAERLPDQARQYAFVERYIQLRERFQKAGNVEGITIALLNDVFDAWASIALEARKEAVPDGADHAGLKAFLRLDHVERFGDGVLMLPSHPLRLRWIARYLEATTKLASQALEGRLRLCSSNPEFYLDWLDGLSPHQHPALTVECDKHAFLFAEGEKGWSELFTPLQPEQNGETSAETDFAMLLEIIRQVHAYLRAHPFKSDGLSLALLLTQASSLPFHLVRNVRQGEFENVPVRLTIIAPRQSWARIREQIEEGEEGNRNLSTGALFPALELVFVDLQPEQTASRVVANVECDIAIVPEFLKDGVRSQEKTETPVSDPGAFDPLLAKQTYVHGGAAGSDISVSLRPKPSDAYLSAWSTMVVRHQRSQAIAPTTPQNDDFLDLRVNFARNAQYFAALHEVSHWVIAVERYLTRQQVESLPSRPDIVTVREGVGLGGLYTLVVSSNSARKLIVERLDRKLVRIVGLGGPVKPESIKTMAAVLYDRTRQLAPRLMLQALGISRVTEEILGVAVGQRYISYTRPPPNDALLVAWLSLDEQTGWFGGASAVRADMVRVSITREGDGLAVDFLVLESKLRRSQVDPHGVQQVMTTLDLLAEAFAPAHEDSAIDSKLWRDSLLAAIEAVDPAARWSSDAGDFGLMDGALTGDARAAFSEGRYVLRSCTGVFVNCTYETSGPTTESTSADPRVAIARCTNDAITEMLRAGSLEPSASDMPSADRTVAVVTGGTSAGQVADVDQVANQDADLSRGQEDVAPLEATDKRVETDARPANCGKLSPTELRQRYQLVLDTLAVHRVDVKRAEEGVPEVVEGPALVLYRIRPAPGVEARRIFEKADALKLALKLSEQQEIRFSIDRGHICIEVPKIDDDRYYVAADQLWSRWSRPEEGLAAPLGEDILGAVVDVRFSSSNSPHLLIGGTTGSGKSEALNTLLGGLTHYYSPEEIRLLLIDPKGTELTHLEGSEFLDGDIGIFDTDAIELLERAVAEMDRRYALFKTARVRTLDQYNSQTTDERVPWWVVVLDEYADLTSDADSKKSIEALLKRLAQKARAAGIHLIIATQKPSAEVISTNLRSNLPAQLALRVRSATESRVIMDESGAEALAGRGDAFLKSEGRLVRVQCAKM
jgi:S-DNA-T family DNA segregation ATPase FtsK/SpoIIIE